MSNFILQQGLSQPAAGGCAIQYSALLFQPRLVGAWILAAAILQAPSLFFALAAALWWSALAPRLNPFDAPYNAILAGPTGVVLAPAPRRFAQLLAGLFAVAIAVCLILGYRTPALALEAFLIAAVGALVLGGFCLGSFRE